MPANPADSSKTVRLVSNPAATVYKGSRRLGRTPVDVEVPADGGPVTVRLKKSGYRTATIAVRSSDGSERQVELEQRSKKPSRAAAPAAHENAEPSEPPPPAAAKPEKASTRATRKRRVKRKRRRLQPVLEEEQTTRRRKLTPVLTE